MHQGARTSALVALIALLVTACMAPGDYSAAADRDAYSLVAARRADIQESPDSFRLETPKGSLRSRLLAGEAPPDHPLALAEILEIAAENSRDFQERRESLYLSALDLTLEQWDLGWIPGAEATFAQSGTGSSSTLQDGTADLGLSKIFGTGGQLLAGLGLEFVRTLGAPGGWTSAGTLSLSFVQPLLRGAGRRIILEPLTQAQRDLVYEVRSYERFRRTFAVDVATRYYQVLQQMDSAHNAEMNFQNLQVLADRNRALAEAGRLDDLEVDQVRQDELRSLDRLLSTRAGLKQAEDSFKLFLGLPIATDLTFDPSELDRLREEEPVPENWSEQLVIEVALQARLDHLTILDEVDDAHRKAEIAGDALRAGLDFTMTAETLSASGRPLDFDLGDSTWTAALGLDLPLDRMAERNAYRASQISHESRRRAAEALGDSIRAALRDALRETEISLRSYGIQRDAVTLAERRVESTSMRLEAGRADTRDILEAEEALLDSRNSLTNVMVDYQLALLALHLDTEHLEVDETGIVLRPLAASGHTSGVEPGQ